MRASANTLNEYKLTEVHIQIKRLIQMFAFVVSLFVTYILIKYLISITVCKTVAFMN